MRTLIMLVLSALFVSPAVADDMNMPPYKGSVPFERLKGLVGRWEGSDTMNKHGGKFVVEYKLTAGESAIIETHFPGTPKEMVSVYHDEGGKCVMTHYCMLGNQPRMKLQTAGEKQMAFLLVDGRGISSATEPHMQAVTISFVDKDNLTQEWTMFEGGKEKAKNTMKLTRVR